MDKIRKVAGGLLLVSFLGQAQAASMDVLLGGFERACDHGKEAREMFAGMCRPVIDKKTGIDGCALGRLVLPKGLEGSLSGLTVKNNGDHSLFTAKFAPGAQWKGLKLVVLEHWIGHGNGIYGAALVLSAPTVQAAAADAKRAGAKWRKEKDEAMGGHRGAEFAKGRDGRPRLVCDVSN